MLDLFDDVGARLMPAGAGVNAIRVNRYLGLKAMTRLPRYGAVAIDPTPGDPAVIFVARSDDTASWVHAPTSSSIDEKVFNLPELGHEHPPGCYWLLPPTKECLYTRLDQLGTALQAAHRMTTER